jgi:hypothetical protein
MAFVSYVFQLQLIVTRAGLLSVGGRSIVCRADAAALAPIAFLSAALPRSGLPLLLQTRAATFTLSRVGIPQVDCVCVMRTHEFVRVNRWKRWGFPPLNTPVSALWYLHITAAGGREMTGIGVPPSSASGRTRRTNPTLTMPAERGDRRGGLAD